MQTYIALLRGINVSGQKMIKMDELKKMCAELGFKNAQTYLQSGNIIFQYKTAPTRSLEKKIADQIKSVFSFDVSVLVLEPAYVKEVFNNNPFVKRNEDISRLYVTFLDGTPEPVAIAKIKEGNYGSDEFIIERKSIYLFSPITGYGNSKLNNNFFESKLKLTATTRNWKTVTELVRLSEEL